MEAGIYRPETLRREVLPELFGWDRREAKKILRVSGRFWRGWGEEEGTNILLDHTHGAVRRANLGTYFSDLFDTVCQRGVLCGEPLRGVRVDLFDCMFGSEVGRSPAQQLCALRRGLSGCILADLDCDGDIDLSDLAELLGAYGTCDGDPYYNLDADFDGSGCIDLADLAELLGRYGVGT